MLKVLEKSGKDKLKGKNKYTSSVGKMVDEYGELNERVSAVLATLVEDQQRMGALKNLIDQHVNDTYEVEEKGVLQGDDFLYQFGARSKKVLEILKSKLIKILGEKRFVEMASIGVGDIRKTLSEDEQKEVLVEAQEGGRTTKVIRKT